MYPEQISFDRKARELNYSEDHANLKLRLPDHYLLDGLPDIISANAGRIDLRSRVKQVISACSPGEEILDSIILAFNNLVEERSSNEKSLYGDAVPNESNTGHSKATVIIWLHHLLNTNKRKQALSPASSSVSGVTKPGYPGVLVYSGPASEVHEHVNELRSLNWQAFQIRFESEEEWGLAHGQRVVEVETMKEVVAEVGDDRKEMFMEAMRMK